MAQKTFHRANGSLPRPEFGLQKMCQKCESLHENIYVSGYNVTLIRKCHMYMFLSFQVLLL